MASDIRSLEGLISQPLLLKKLSQYLTVYDVVSNIVVSKAFRSCIAKMGSAAFENLLLDGRLDCGRQLQAIASNKTISRGVTKISCEFALRLTDDALKVLKLFSVLTSLNLNGCGSLTDTSLKYVAECSNLISLSLYWLPAFTNKGLAYITESDIAGQLTYLNLSGVKHLTDDAIARLARACPRLQFLDLTRLERIRDSALAAISRCSHLTSLNLYACAHYGDKGIIDLTSGCKKLTFLDLCGAHSVSDSAIAAIAKNCAQISSLNLTWCVKLTDLSLEHMSASLKQLRTLSLHGIKQITTNGMKQLSQGCSLIETLDVNGLINVDRQALPTLFPKLKCLVSL
jgi:F-box/leucine-rich repeat protein 2/20